MFKYNYKFQNILFLLYIDCSGECRTKVEDSGKSESNRLVATGRTPQADEFNNSTCGSPTGRQTMCEFLLWHG